MTPGCYNFWCYDSELKESVLLSSYLQKQKVPCLVEWVRLLVMCNSVTLFKFQRMKVLGKENEKNLL